MSIASNRGGFRGSGADAPLQGFDPLPTQRDPLWYFLRNPFLLTDPNTFLKASSAPTYTNFEGEARAEKTQFFGQNFPKSA